MPLTNGGPVPQSFEPIFGFISVHMMSDQRLATLNQKLDPKPKIGMFLGVQPVASSLQVHHGWAGAVEGVGGACIPLKTLTECSCE